MRTSAKGRRLLEAREGVRLAAYRDTQGIWTIGVGHTAAAGFPHPVKGMRLTAEQVDAVFTSDLVQYEHAVETALKVTVNQRQFDALVSITFNIGIGGMRNSSFMRLINGKASSAAIGVAMMKWTKNRELIGRRRSEVRQFLGEAEFATY
jgi:GH24 family phage-related lysozyme (muramidase)